MIQVTMKQQKEKTQQLSHEHVLPVFLLRRCVGCSGKYRFFNNNRNKKGGCEAPSERPTAGWQRAISLISILLIPNQEGRSLADGSANITEDMDPE